MIDTILISFGIYVVLGLFAGLIAGLFGVGGGLIIVPALVWLFRSQGFDESVVVHLAIGSSLATIVVTSIGSIRAHHKRGSLSWNMVARLTPGIVTGALVGAWVADQFSTLWLQRFVAIFIILIGAQLVINRTVQAHRPMPGMTGISLAGLVIGLVSAMAGIGGGSLTVPYLVWYRLPIVQAIGTASACGFPIALAGAFGFSLAGWGTTTSLAFSTGYLYWPAILGITVTSFAMTRAGVHLAHRLPVTALKKLFAGFLVLVGVHLLQ